MIPRLRLNSLGRPNSFHLDRRMTYKAISLAFNAPAFVNRNKLFMASIIEKPLLLSFIRSSPIKIYKNPAPVDAGKREGDERSAETGQYFFCLFFTQKGKGFHAVFGFYYFNGFFLLIFIIFIQFLVKLLYRRHGIRWRNFF